MAHPEKLGKYNITGVLGEGAMGVVYQGYDPDICRVVALKTIRQDLDDGSEYAEKIMSLFRNEAQAAGRLQHPGIVAVHDFGADGSTAYLAMEFVEGNNLSHYLQKKIRFTDDDIHSVICQLLDALDHAHEKGVWHRDIKPANIIMTRSGRIKIADFGIARIESANLNRTSTMVGTPSHMAPEQFLGTPIDRRVDLYGAGVLLFQLLTGQQPFTGRGEALIAKVLHEPPPLPSSTEDGAQRPRGYDAIIARALAKRADDRFQTAREFRSAVQAAIGTTASDVVSDRTVVLLPPRRPPAALASTAPTVLVGVPGTESTTAGSIAAPAPTETDQSVTNWDASVLSQVEATLTRHVGPVARFMVRRAARNCDDLNTLWDRLAGEVDGGAVRDALLAEGTRLKQTSTFGLTRSGTGTNSRAGVKAIDDSLRERAGRLLAQQVGPIAQVLVRKAAAATNDRGLFVARLSESISDPAKRQAFIDGIDRSP